MSQRTVFIVDDHREFRESARWWLSGAGFEVQGFDSPHEALEHLSRWNASDPACLLLDVRMPGMSGLELHDALLQRCVALPVIYMTGHGDVPLAVEAMQRGAVTFLEKPFANAALEEALERAFRSPPRVTAVTVGDEEAPEPAAAPEHHWMPAADDEAAREYVRRHDKLTPREREVLQWVVEGKLNKTIADLLGISIKTVELHRSRVMAKLQARSITQLMRMVVSRRVS
ncbi:response regulator [Schlegelella sp. S2-27]|uniref:Response regulator n=1 Tax=Caldimonas mangrovi TaxID=2944811 RepID=A0ABT0YHV0_9BURK|nr:response regulator [Caldimonas mangrovi]MCM5678268.1 response regulator [Caldimonas mangrovi]